MLVGADLCLVLLPGLWGVVVGVGLWGVHLASSQGLLSALVSDAAPADRRGTAFGLFNLLTGGALLLASLLAGVLWQRLGPDATFLTGAGFAGSAALALLVGGGRGQSTSSPSGLVTPPSSSSSSSSSTTMSASSSMGNSPPTTVSLSST